MMGSVIRGVRGVRGGGDFSVGEVVVGGDAGVGRWDCWRFLEKGKRERSEVLRGFVCEPMVHRGCVSKVQSRRDEL